MCNQEPHSSKIFTPSNLQKRMGSLNDIPCLKIDTQKSKSEVSLKANDKIDIKRSFEKFNVFNSLMEGPPTPSAPFKNNFRTNKNENLSNKTHVSCENEVPSKNTFKNNSLPPKVASDVKLKRKEFISNKYLVITPNDSDEVAKINNFTDQCNRNVGNLAHESNCPRCRMEKVSHSSRNLATKANQYDGEASHRGHVPLLKTVSLNDKGSYKEELLMRQNSMLESSLAIPKNPINYHENKLNLKQKHWSDPGCSGDASCNCTVYFSDSSADPVISGRKIKKVFEKRTKCLRSLSARYNESQESTDDERWIEPTSSKLHPNRRRRNLSPSVILLDSNSSSQNLQIEDNKIYHHTSSRNISPSPFSFYGDSDCCEKGIPRSPYETRRYSKRPLRGPYGEMLEAEMNKVKPSSPLQDEEILIHHRDDQGAPPYESSIIVTEIDNFPQLTTSEECVATFRLQVSPFQPYEQAPIDVHCEKYYEDENLNALRVSPTATQICSSGDRLSPLPVGPYHQRTASSPSKLCSESEFLEYNEQNSSLCCYLSNNNSAIASSAPHITENNFDKLSLGPDLTLDVTNKQEKFVQSQNTKRNQDETLRLLAQLMLKSKNSSVDFRLINEHHRHMRLRHQDTRAHIIEEIYETEKNYVENLNFLLKKYQLPLRNSESGSIIESTLCDDIFFQIPEIYAHHERLLKDLKLRLQSEESTICVGDLLLQLLQDPTVIDSYKSFVNNWKTAQEATKIAAEAKPAFKNFLQAMAKEHPGKLDLKALLIAPVQRFPHYELILKRLLDHTFEDHPDYTLVQEAISEVQKVAASINDIKQEALQLEQQQFTLKEIENSIEGLVELVQPDRSFLQLDQVSHNSGLGLQKERCLFLFSDILVISSVKRRSIASSKSSSLQMTLLSSLDSCKLKLFKFISLDDLEIGRSRDESIKKLVKEIDNLGQDIQNISNISRLAKTLNFPSGALEDSIQEHETYLKKQLLERQGADSPLFELELIVTSQEGIESLTFMFSSGEKRNKWEEAFNVAKQKLSMSADRRPPPEFVTAIPIRKTRAGLQFTCASPSLGCNAHNLKDVWVCNSDGYVGQVCVISLLPEPMIACCSGVCNAKILSIASIPAAPNQDSSDDDEEEEVTDDENFRKRRSESLPPEIRNSEVEKQQSTMWLGTEDGSIHVYNCNDAIRSKKNKFKFQPGSPVHCIIYIENRVFASLANGDIIVYERDGQGGWNSGERHVISLSTAAAPVTKMVIAAGKLWCCLTNVIKILNINSLEVEHSFVVGEEMSKGVSCIVSAGHGVWVAIHSSAAVRLYHTTTHELVCEVNITSAVAKMLASCDDIIRQHKLACLKVTSLLACKDLLWVGTSAGVIITLPILRFSNNARRLLNVPTTVGIPHGHTGNVRFLTSVELTPEPRSPLLKYHSRSFKGKDHLYHHQLGTAAPTKLLVISGGDGYEDFRNGGLSELAGKDDSTNHLLMWKI